MTDQIIDEQRRVQTWFNLMTSNGYSVEIGQDDCLKRDGKNCDLPPKTQHTLLFYNHRGFYRCGGYVWCVWIEDTFECDRVCVAAGEVDEVQSITSY